MAQNPQYSLRAFARSLQVPVSSLSRALTGKRAISLAAAQKVVTRLCLSPRERNLFFASIERPAPGKGTTPPSDAAHADVHALDEEAFRVIADWHHYAILEMIYLKSFRADPLWVAKKLGISPIEASLAIGRLESLGLVKRDGKKLIKTQRTIWAHGGGGQTSGALRTHQKQSLKRAIEAIDNIPFEQRTSSVMTMPIDPKKLPLARRLIEEFAVDLCRTLSSQPVSDVYQLTISFHSLLQGEKS